MGRVVGDLYGWCNGRLSALLALGGLLSISVLRRCVVMKRGRRTKGCDTCGHGYKVEVIAALYVITVQHSAQS